MLDLELRESRPRNKRQPAGEACFAIARLSGTGERNLTMHLQGPTLEPTCQRWLLLLVRLSEACVREVILLEVGVVSERCSKPAWIPG